VCVCVCCVSMCVCVCVCVCIYIWICFDIEYTYTYLVYACFNGGPFQIQRTSTHDDAVDQHRVALHAHVALPPVPVAAPIEPQML
jgi:hypothetical protein